MKRAYDVRRTLSGFDGESRRLELQEVANSISDHLSGDHRLFVETVNPITGCAGLVRSTGAQPAGTDVVRSAVEHVNAIRPALGLTSQDLLTFAEQPTALTTSAGTTAVHLQQVIAGLRVFQAIRTVIFDATKRIRVTDGVTVIPTAGSVRPTLSATDAVFEAARFLAASVDPDERAGEPLVDPDSIQPMITVESAGAGMPVIVQAPPFDEDIAVTLLWFDGPDTVRLGWEVVIGFPDGGHVYRLVIDATDGRVLFSCQSSFSVAARSNVAVPDPGALRQLRDLPLQRDSYDLARWSTEPHVPQDDWIEAQQTAGNYVRAHLEGSAPTFGVIVDGVVTFDPGSATDGFQQVVTLHYLCSYMHDYLLLLGFNAGNGNFENAGNDAVDAKVFPVPVSGTANIDVQANGIPPNMNMGISTASGRHTALDADVVFHEYTHGLTTRLVGGPENADSLTAVQSRGLGEGWSDYLACTINKRTVLGAWLMNNGVGLRGFAYDENYPDHFGMLGKGRYAESNAGIPWNLGEIWCAALLELNRQVGARLAVQVVVDALMLTPANPTFLQARDAIFDALHDRSILEHWTLAQLAKANLRTWRSFAKFGMGPKAAAGPSDGLEGFVPDFGLPPYSATIYAVTDSTFRLSDGRTTRAGDLLWYRHDGRPDGAMAWKTVRKPVGTGWVFSHIVGNGDGVVYAVTATKIHIDRPATGGELLWYRHDGRRNGEDRWSSTRLRPFDTPWTAEHIFSGGDGVFYWVSDDGNLRWIRHDGYVDGTERWTRPEHDVVGRKWKFKSIFSGGNGVIYAVTEQVIRNDPNEPGAQGGALIWFRHDGWRDGSDRWAAKGHQVLRTDWTYEHTFSGEDGVIYAVSKNGDLHWFRHDGRHDGSKTWAANSGSVVGNGWHFKNIFTA